MGGLRGWGRDMLKKRIEVSSLSSCRQPSNIRAHVRFSIPNPAAATPQFHFCPPCWFPLSLNASPLMQNSDRAVGP